MARSLRLNACSMAIHIRELVRYASLGDVVLDLPDASKCPHLYKQ